MKKSHVLAGGLVALAVASVLLLARSPAAQAHCDSMDGPVVRAGRAALQSGNLDLALPWVREQDEPALREAFQHALAVRRLNHPQATGLADRYFFESLVRIHRAGEGAPYTGLRPAGQDHGPALPAAEHALSTGSVDAVEQLLVEAVRNGLRQRFQAARAARTHAPDDVRAGREEVRRYVDYLHFAQGVYQAASGAAHHEEETAALPPAGHAHGHAHGPGH